MPIRPSIGVSAVDASVLLHSGLLGVDMVQMHRAGPSRPRILALIRGGRLRYVPDDPNEQWQTYDDLLAQLRARGVALGDCEDLATALAAEFRVDEIDVRAIPVVYRSGPHLSHVVTWAPTLGETFDPSAWAGMRVRPGLRVAPMPWSAPVPRGPVPLGPHYGPPHRRRFPAHDPAGPSPSFPMIP